MDRTRTSQSMGLPRGACALAVMLVLALLCLFGSIDRAVAVGDYQYSAASTTLCYNQGTFASAGAVFERQSAGALWHVSAPPATYVNGSVFGSCWGVPTWNASIFQVDSAISSTANGTINRWTRVDGTSCGDAALQTVGPSRACSSGNTSANMLVIQYGNASYGSWQEHWWSSLYHVSDNQGPSISGLGFTCLGDGYGFYDGDGGGWAGNNDWCGGRLQLGFNSTDNGYGSQNTNLYIDGGLVAAWDNSANGAYGWTGQTGAPGSGCHSVQVARAGDGWGTSQQSNVACIDLEAPTAESQTASTDASGNIRFGWYEYDAHSGTGSAFGQLEQVANSGNWTTVGTFSGYGQGGRVRSETAARPNWPTGTYRYRVRILDRVSREAITGVSTVFLDNTTPTVPSVSGGSNAWQAGPVTITASGSTDADSGIYGYESQISADNGATWGSTTTGASNTISAGGDWVVRFRARDNQGNVSAWTTVSNDARARIDKTPPSMPTVSGGSANWQNVASITISASGSSDLQSTPVSYEYRTSTNQGATWGSPQPGASVVITAPGETLVQFRAKDSSGNSSRWVWSVTGPQRANNIVGQWTFDNMVDGVFQDYSGLGRSASAVGTSTDVAGRTGSPEAANRARNVSNNGSFSIPSIYPSGNAFSYEIWFKLNTLNTPSTWNTLISAGNCCAESYATFVQADGYIHQVLTLNGSRVAVNSASGVVEANKWQHYVLTWNGSTATGYLNGVAVLSGAASGSMTQNTGPSYIGLRYGDALPLDGQIDEVTLYNSALSAGDVAARYDQGFAPGTARIDRSAPADPTVSGGSLAWSSGPTGSVQASQSDDSSRATFQTRVSRNGGSTWSTPYLSINGDLTSPGPAAVPDLGVWLRADAIAGAGDGDPVTRWPDSSGKARDFSQTLPQFRPTYVASDINGKPALRFNGVTTFMSNNGFSLPAQTTTFAVATSGGNSGHQRILSREGFFFFGTYQNQFASFYGNGSWGTTASHGTQAALTLNQPYVLSSVNNGTDNAYVNGQLVDSRANAMAATGGGLEIGCYLNPAYPWRTCNYGQTWNGDIAEILVFERALSAAERIEVEAYLMRKYGLTPPYTHEKAGDGETLVQVRAQDPLGQTSNWVPAHSPSPTAGATIRLDRVAPSVPSVAGGGLSWASSKTLTASGSTDTASGVVGYEYRRSSDFGATWSAVQSGASTTITTSGDWRVQFRAVDAAGNRSAWSNDAVGAVTSLSPLGYWRLNDSSGATIADATPTPHNGAAVGSGMTYSRAGPHAYSTSTGIGFSSADDDGWLEVPHHPSLYPGSTVSVSVWAKSAAGGLTNQSLVAKGPGCLPAGYLVFTNYAGRGHAAFYVGGGTWVEGNTNVTDNQWHHIVGTFDGSTSRLYVDGVLDGSIATSGNLAGSSAIQIGDSNFCGASLSGDESDVAIFSSVLSAAQISGIYNASVSSQGYARVDVTPPSAPTISGAPAGWGDYASVTLVASGSSDAHSGLQASPYRYQVSSDGGATWATQQTGSSVTITNEGDYRVRFRALDNAGNFSDWTTVQSKIDRSIPTMPTVSGGSAAWQAGPLTLTASGSSDPSGIDHYESRVSSDGGATWSAAASGASRVISAEGATKVQFRAVDQAGRTSAWTGPYATTATALAPSAYLRLSETASSDDANYPTRILSQSPIAYWRLNETSGTSVADSSGNGRTASVGAGVSLGQPGIRPMSASGSAYFGGSGQITYNGTAGLGANNVVLEAWVNIASLPTKGTFVHVGNGANGYAMGIGNTYFDNDGTRFLALFESVRWIDSGYSFPAAGKYHVAIKITPANWIIFYVNGQVVGINSGGAAAIAPTGTINIGGYYGVRGFTGGRVQDAAIYSGDPADSVLAANYQAAGTRAWNSIGTDQYGRYSGDPLSGAAAAGPLSGQPEGHLDTNAAKGSVDLASLPVVTSAGAKTTVSFWMNWDGVAGERPFGFDAYSLLFAGGSFGFSTENGSDVYGIASAGLANRWSHVVAEFTNGSVGTNRLWIDGVPQTLSQRQGTPVARSVSASARASGYSGSSSGRFAARLDDLTVQNGSLTQGQIDALYEARNARQDAGMARVDSTPPSAPVLSGSSASWSADASRVVGASGSSDALSGLRGYRSDVLNLGPIGYWRLGEASGSVAADSSGDGRNGSYQGVTLNQDPAPVIGDDRSASFNGSSTVTLPRLNLVQTSFTIEAWVKPSGTPTGCIFRARNADASGQNLGLCTSGSQTRLGYYSDDLDGPALAAGQWSLVSASYDAVSDTSRLFVNGVQVASGSQGPLTGGVPTITIGEGFVGQIDDVVVYPRALSPGQIAVHAAEVGSYQFEISSDAGATYAAPTLANQATITNEGDFRVRVRAIDAAGNLSAAQIAIVRLDHTPPSDPTTFSGGSLSWRNDASVTVSASGASDAVSGIAAYRYRTSTDGGTSWSASSIGQDAVISAEGQTLVQFQARDGAGNWSATWVPAHPSGSPTAAATVRLDRSAPNAPTLSGAGGAWSNDASRTVSATATDNGPAGIAGYEYQLSSDGGATWSAPAAGASVAISAEGETLVRFRAIDNATNVGPWSATGAVRLDRSAPGAPLAVTGGSLEWQDLASVDVSASGGTDGLSGLAGYEWRLKDSATITAGQTATITSEGESLVQFRSRDAAGNVSAWVPSHSPEPVAGATVRLDRNNPNPPSVSGGSLSWQSVASVTISASGGSDPGGSGLAGYEFQTSADQGASWSAVSAGAEAPISTEGETWVRMRSRDNAGNVSAWVPNHQPNAPIAAGVVRIDRTAPLSPVASGGSLTWVNAASRVVAASGQVDALSGINRVERRSLLDAGGWSAPSTGTSLTVTAEGQTLVQFRSVDNAGNVSAWSPDQSAADPVAAATVRLDRTGPSAPDVTGGSLNWVEAGPITITGSGSTDAHSGVVGYRYRTSTNGGSSWSSIHAGTSVAIEDDGETLVQFQALDAAGNTSTWAPTHSPNPVAGGTARIDSEEPGAPTLEYSDGDGSNWYLDPVTITATPPTADPGGAGIDYYQYQLSDDAGVTPGATVRVEVSEMPFPTELTTEGDYRLRFRAIDTLGRPSAWATAVARLDLVAPALTGIDFAPGAGSEDHLFRDGSDIWFNSSLSGSLDVSLSGSDGGFPADPTTNWPSNATISVIAPSWNHATMAWQAGSSGIDSGQLTTTAISGRASNAIAGFRMLADATGPSVRLQSPGGDEASGVDAYLAGTFSAADNDPGIPLSWLADDEQSGIRTAADGFGASNRPAGVVIARRSAEALPSSGACPASGDAAWGAWTTIASTDPTPGQVDLRTSSENFYDTTATVAPDGPATCFQWRLVAADKVGNQATTTSGRVLVFQPKPVTALPPLRNDGTVSSGSIAVGRSLNLFEGSRLNDPDALDEISDDLYSNYFGSAGDSCSQATIGNYFCGAPWGRIDLLAFPNQAPATLTWNGAPISGDVQQQLTESYRQFVRAVRGAGSGTAVAPKLRMPDLATPSSEDGDWYAAADPIDTRTLAAGGHFEGFLRTDGPLVIPAGRQLTISGGLIVHGNLTLGAGANLSIAKDAGQWGQPGLIVTGTLNVQGRLAVQGLLWARHGAVQDRGQLTVAGAALFGKMDGTAPAEGNDASFVQLGTLVVQWDRRVLGLRGVARPGTLSVTVASQIDGGPAGSAFTPAESVSDAPAEPIAAPQISTPQVSGENLGFSYTTAGAAGALCRIDSKAPVSCPAEATSSFQLPIGGLKPGTHVLTITVFNAGGRQASAASEFEVS